MTRQSRQMVVFVGLGLTVDITELGQQHRWLDGLILAALLIFIARPLALAPLLAPLRLSNGERLFIMWSGLKGAVPILLASFVVLSDVADARRIYGVVFVVVAVSVVVQASSVPYVARRFRVPMRCASQTRFKGPSFSRPARRKQSPRLEHDGARHVPRAAATVRGFYGVDKSASVGY